MAEKEKKMSLSDGSRIKNVRQQKKKKWRNGEDGFKREHSVLEINKRSDFEEKEKKNIYFASR